ncbi:hypothetical protein AC579_4680 [Pseudocercospora musae]|uniref:Uncharacterized protein n=1 Tax=Pseudocercospora musae TaxID=113226 RepID=A0A139IBB3_9PEZI|nr:hypothetical protein AC579_4680 [Pseudocercospora musae]KXT12037.1 hypothetical protein AC579_4680 [Pseudocercospora musae]
MRMLFPITLPRIEATVSANGSSKTKSSDLESDLPGQLYYTHVPGLPVNRPIGYPHVVDTTSFDEDTGIDSLTLGDGISTFLWLWNRNEFHNFFNLSHPKFEIWYRSPNGVIRDMAILRSDRNVMVGLRRRSKTSIGQPSGPPSPQIISLIDRNGKWCGRACSEAPHAIEWYGSQLAKTIIYHKLWDLQHWNATVTICHDLGEGDDCFR